MTDYPDLFRSRYDLSGKAWLRDIPAEDRLVFSRLGHMALRQRNVPLQHLGGKARIPARCAHCGRFQAKEASHTHPPVPTIDF
jgi:hypothetical protein